jgi:phosphoglycolate phosphatase
VYEGVSEMLNELSGMKLNLYIATNKRTLPTRKIVEYFGWDSIFNGVFSLDYYNPPILNKAEMLKRLIRDLESSSMGMIYVGDRREDAEAAKNANIPFILASWGYGIPKESYGETFRLEQPSELLGLLQRFP